MDIVTKSLNYLKSLTAETISFARSGHTGSALGASSILFALFHNHLQFDCTGNNWPNRDRFVLSAGHSSALLYSLFYMFGYPITINDLKNFRRYGSKTPGHPEYGVTEGVETTTGPLGQGVATAVGLALAAEKMNAISPNLFNNYTYVYAGDGCLMEGVAQEACSLAGKLCLKNLILLYDDNDVTLDGDKSISNNENTVKKFEAMGWDTIVVEKGNDYNECSKAIARAKTNHRPTLILFRTIIGIGTTKQGTCGVHGYPLPETELKTFKQNMEITDDFFVPDDVLAFCREATEKNNKLISKWNEFYEKNKANIDKALKQNSRYNLTDLCKKISTANPEITGRDVSNIILNELYNLFPFFGGSADLASSTKAFIKNVPEYEEDALSGNNIRFGVREHAMGAVANGIALYYKFLAFDSTFVSFSNYMIPALRLRAMMGIPVLSIMTHDSINIGEDGPTHQPIEQIPQMRSIVGLTVFRPATIAEVMAGYKYFVTKQKPTVLALTKTKISNPKYSTVDKADKGGYIIYETEKAPTIEIIATGTEVYLAIEVATKLEKYGARVISMPCESIFDKQTENYKSKILLENPKLKVAIEATNDNVWYKYIGENGLLININSYQHSGNGKEVYEKAGFESERIVKEIREKLKKVN